MAKSTHFSEADLERMGLVKQTDGSFKREIRPEPVKHLRDTALLVERKKIKDTSDFVVNNKQKEWFIPYQVPSKKNCRRVFVDKQGKIRNIPSDRYKEYVRLTSRYYEVFGLEFARYVRENSLKLPLEVKFTFIRSINQRFDYVGPLETVQDIMVDFGWLADDDAKNLKPHLGYYEVNKKNPGVRIKIL